MFFYQNTLYRLDEAGFKAEFSSSETTPNLPHPEVYIIVDSKPTVWQGLVNIDNVKCTVEKMRDTNWLYRNVDECSVDEVAKKHWRL